MYSPGPHAASPAHVSRQDERAPSSPTTANAIQDGTRAEPFLCTYPRSWMVPMIDEYVDGRPIPNSSNVFTSEASVYRAGGLVVCPSGRSSVAVSD